jgi:hypothetical protein
MVNTMKKILLCTALLTSYATIAHGMEKHLATEEKATHITYKKPDEKKLKKFVAEHISEGLETRRLSYADENGTWMLSGIAGNHLCKYWKERMQGTLEDTILSLGLSITPNLPRDTKNCNWDFVAWDKESFTANIGHGGANLVTFWINKKN